MRARALSVVGLVLATVVVLVITRGGPAQTTVHVTVAEARGVVDGADVMVGGVRVGHVTRVRLDRRGRPALTLRVDEDVDLRAGARAAVRLASQSGEFNRYVALTPGTGAPLPRPWTLGLARTSAPVEVDEALSALDPTTRAQVRATLHGLRGALDGTGPADSRTLKSAPTALAEVAGVLDDVSSDGAALRTLVQASRRITGSLAGRPAELQSSLASMRALLQTTAAREEALRASLAGLPAGLRAPRRALATTRAALPDLRGLVRDAAPVTSRLTGVSRELRATTRAARPALRQAAGVARTAPGDLRALRPLLREATPLVQPLDPVLRRLGPMLDQARVRLPDFFSFFSNWADFTGNYDANGHGARVGILLPPASTQALSPSGSGAGQLRAPYLRTPGSLEGDPWKSYADSFVAGGAAAQDVKP